MNSNPSITVIALCYNHQRFLIECLESIRAQTFQDFELIVTDDFSRDNSPDLIEVWLAKHRPDALFIRHLENAGLCKTLNEAIANAHGDFISMIATDDAWEPDKIERQLTAICRQPERVAVVYSDALQMDESGSRLAQTFIENHRPGCEPPSGQIFSVLADGNFIPAMATLIRRQAILAAGGYDERLTYEDYDMWLRLAQRYDVIFCPGAVARYRIVSNSIIRTVFAKPTANHCYTLFLIREKWLTSDLLSPAQRVQWAENQYMAAYELYVHDDPRARSCLWKVFFRTRKFRVLLLALAYSLNISRQRAKKLISILAGWSE